MLLQFRSFWLKSVHRADIPPGSVRQPYRRAKKCIHVNKKVTNIEITGNIVSVSLSRWLSIPWIQWSSDADGVQQHRENPDPSCARTQRVTQCCSISGEASLSAVQTVFGSVPRPAELSPGDLHESHGKDRSTQLTNGNDKTWFFLYQRLETGTSDRTTHHGTRQGAMC